MKLIGGNLSGTKIPLPQVSSLFSSFHFHSNFQSLYVIISLYYVIQFNIGIFLPHPIFKGQ